MKNHRQKISFRAKQLSVLEVKLPALFDQYQTGLMDYPYSKRSLVLPEKFFADHLSNTTTIERELDTLLKFVIEDNYKKVTNKLKLHDVNSTFYGFFRRVAKELNEIDQNEVVYWIAKKRGIKKRPTRKKLKINFKDIFKSGDYSDSLLKVLKSIRCNLISSDNKWTGIQAEFIALLMLLILEERLNSHHPKSGRKFSRNDYAKAFQTVVWLPYFSNLYVNPSNKTMARIEEFLSR